MNKKKTEGLISNGVDQQLDLLKFHDSGPIRRLLMSGTGASQFNMHIAVHEISKFLEKEIRDYSLPHRHNCDEWNIILSSSILRFTIMLDGEVHIVDAPATVYIPAGTLHSANVLEGEGHFIALVDTLDYDSSFIPE